MAQTSTKPTESELEILQVLWENEPSTIRQLNDIINKKGNGNKGVGYTTTLKIAQLMVGKKVLAADKTRRQHVFYPLVHKEEIQRILLARFLHTTYSGSASRLVTHLLAHHVRSNEEWQEIKEIIRETEKNNKD